MLLFESESQIMSNGLFMQDFLGSFLSQWRETGSSRVWATEIKHLLQLFLKKNLFLSLEEV